MYMYMYMLYSRAEKYDFVTKEIPIKLGGGGGASQSHVLFHPGARGWMDG